MEELAGSLIVQGANTPHQAPRRLIPHDKLTIRVEGELMKVLPICAINMFH